MVDDVLKVLGLTEKSHFLCMPDGGERLSGGQLRRIGIGMEIVVQPPILLLDEPTAGINPTLINGLIDRLKRANEEMGVTLFVTEHNMRVVMNLASHVYCLAHGKLLAGGPPSEIQNDQKVIDAYLGAH